MSFAKCLSHVLKSEGGFVDHPKDRGGPTNMGITLSTLAKFRNRNVSPDDIKTLTYAEAASIYHREYWQRIQGDRLREPAVQLVIFDQAVNSGVSRAVKRAQVVVNLVAPKGTSQLAVDGIMGPMTANAINACDPLLFARRYIQASQLYYAAVVASRPDQAAFIKGWLGRTHALQDAVESPAWASEVAVGATPATPAPGPRSGQAGGPSTA